MGATRYVLLCATALALALAGCKTTRPPEEQVQLEQQQLRAADDADCRELGFEPGTEGYNNCRVQLEQIHGNENAAAASQAAHTNPGNSAKILEDH